MKSLVKITKCEIHDIDLIVKSHVCVTEIEVYLKHTFHVSLQLQSMHEGMVMSCDISYDGKYMLSCTDLDNSVTIWDMRQQKSIKTMKCKFFYIYISPNSIFLRYNSIIMQCCCGQSNPICNKALQKIHRQVDENLFHYVTHCKKIVQTPLLK